ncbi:MAG: hypothetical protein ACI9S8_001907 [Chlamydiales bacterium]|jgi:hypothetical protein
MAFPFTSFSSSSSFDEVAAIEQRHAGEDDAVFLVANARISPRNKECPVDFQHLRKRITQLEPKEFSPIFDVFQFVGDLEDLWDFVDDGNLFEMNEQRQQGVMEEGDFIDRKTFFQTFYGQSGRILRYSESDFDKISNKKLQSKLRNCQKLLRASFERLIFQYKNAPLDEVFEKEVRKHLMGLGRAFLHCYDRIEQDCTVVYNDLFGSTLGLLTVEEEVLSHLQSLRVEILGQIVAEIGNKEGFEEMDVSSTVEQYHRFMGDELGLKESSGSCFKVAPEGLDPEIREGFHKSYTFSAMRYYLDSQMKGGKLLFSRVYSWFEERSQEGVLGENIFDSENVRFRFSAWKVLLQSMEVLR